MNHWILKIKASNTLASRKFWKQQRTFGVGVNKKGLLTPSILNGLFILSYENHIEHTHINTDPSRAK